MTARVRVRSSLSLLPFLFLSNDCPSRAQRGRRWCCRPLWPSRACAPAAVVSATAEFISFLCFIPMPLGGGRAGAGVGPLVGARIHQSVGAPPLRGSSSVLFRAQGKTPRRFFPARARGSAGAAGGGQRSLLLLVLGFEIYLTFSIRDRCTLL